MSAPAWRSRVDVATRAVVAIATALAVVAGGPVALARFGRLDALAGFARLVQHDWTAAWTTRDDGSLMLGTITAVGWVAWALATLSLIAEVVAAATRQRHRLRLPGLGLFAPASAVLVTAVVALVAGQATAPGPADHEGPADDAEAPVLPAMALAAAPRPAQEHDPAHDPVNGPAVMHLVQPGDDLWSLAERYYGDGAKWRAIAGANDTVLIEGTEMLRPGMTLAIPSTAAGPSAGSGAAGEITVQPGDSLSSLALAHLGDPGRWTEMAVLNSGRVIDPDEIDVGWRLKVPPAAPPSAGAAINTATGATPAADLEGPQPSSELAQAPVLPDPVAEDLKPDKPVPKEPMPRSVPQGSPPRGSSPAPLDSSHEPVARAARAGQSTGWPAALVAAAIGPALAASLIGLFRWRRRQQQQALPLGRRMPPVPEASESIRAALEQVAAPGQQPARAPVVVELGEGPGGVVRLDLERTVVTALWGHDGDDIALATAIALQLACEGAEVTTTVVAGAEFGWMATLDEPNLLIMDDADAGLRELRSCVAQRLAGLPSGSTVAGLRSEPDLAEAWAPRVFVLAASPEAGLPPDMDAVGVACVVCGDVPGAGAVVRVAGGRAECTGVAESFVPRLVPAPARRALAEIFETVNVVDFPPAPWWDDGHPTGTPGDPTPLPLPAAARRGYPEEPPMSQLHASQLHASPLPDSPHPVLLLLGPVEVAGAHGPLPARAVKQCEEYCAWLLEHPGTSGMVMAQSLLVAEGTRRSNMSRLRTWLGTAPDGGPYLPAAYGGRISLHPAVTSDWETMRLCVSGGVNHAGDAALVRALSLVRGAPLADAAPGQWHWAEQLRADMTALIRDIGVVLAERAMVAGDFELALWAVERAQLAAPDDEFLLRVQLRLADAVGDRTEVERLVMQITRRARLLGVDLSDELVVLLQQVVEGRSRLRA